MKNSSFALMLVAAGIASGCGARTSEDDLLAFSPPAGVGGRTLETGGSDPVGVGGQPVGTGGEVGGNSGACCFSTDTPGCAEPGVMECVCESDAFCCDSEWDQACVDRANDECGASCGGGTGGISSGGTGGIINAGGSGGIVGTGGTGGVIFTGGTGGFIATGGSGGGVGGNCCSSHPGQGCQVPSVQECVCGDDPYCCENQWDNACVARAESCGADCGGGNTGGTGGSVGTGGSGGNSQVCSDLFPGSCGNCLCSNCFGEMSQCFGNEDCAPLIICGFINSCSCDGVF